MGSIFLSRVLGLVRDSVMLSTFGVGIEVDAYNQAILIPDLLFMLIAGGGLSSAFIPVFSELLHTNRRKEAWKFFSVVTCVCSAVVLVLIGVAWALAPQIAHSVLKNAKDSSGHSISAAIEPMATNMGRILLPAQFAFLIGSILLGTLYARRQFLAPALAPNVYNVGIIAGAVIGGHSRLGISGMAFGGLIGALIGNLAMPVLFMSRMEGQFKPSFNLQAVGVKKFFVLLTPVILGFSLPSVCQMLTKVFAAQYPEGTTSILNQGNTLMLAPNGIFGQALALAAFPVLAQFYANKRMDSYREEINRTIRTVIYLAMPSTALMLALAPQIVHVLYGYGKANHSPQQLEQIGLALRVYSFSVVAWCVQPVLMRGFFSAQKTLYPIALSTGMTGLFIVLAWGCTALHLPALGLAVSSDIAAMILAVILFRALEKEVGKLGFPTIFTTSVKAFGGSLAIGIFAFGFGYLFQTFHLATAKPLEIVELIVTLTFSLWIYYTVTKAMKMRETKYFERAASKFKSKVE
jgi:putative peptidoglycan lipid II flippase